MSDIDNLLVCFILWIKYHVLISRSSAWYGCRSSVQLLVMYRWSCKFRGDRWNFLLEPDYHTKRKGIEFESYEEDSTEHGGGDASNPEKDIDLSDSLPLDSSEDMYIFCICRLEWSISAPEGNAFHPAANYGWPYKTCIEFVLKFQCNPLCNFSSMCVQLYIPSSKV